MVTKERITVIQAVETLESSAAMMTKSTLSEFDRAGGCEDTIFEI